MANFVADSVIQKSAVERNPYVVVVQTRLLHEIGALLSDYALIGVKLEVVKIILMALVCRTRLHAR